MTIIATDMRATVESARRIRYEPTTPFTATNVQDAIGQARTLATIATPTSVTIGMSPYTPSNADRVLLVNTSAGSVTINLQPQAARLVGDLIIKDDTGNAAANPISVVPNGAETVDGLAPYPIDSNFGGATLSPQSTGYFIKP